GQQVHGDGGGGDGEDEGGRGAGVHQAVPGIHGYAEDTPRLPFEDLRGFVAVAPDLGAAVALDHEELFLVDVTLGFEGAGCRDLDQIHAGLVVRAFELDEGAIA